MICTGGMCPSFINLRGMISLLDSTSDLPGSHLPGPGSLVSVVPGSLHTLIIGSNHVPVLGCEVLA